MMVGARAVLMLTPSCRHDIATRDLGHPRRGKVPNIRVPEGVSGPHIKILSLTFEPSKAVIG